MTNRTPFPFQQLLQRQPKQPGPSSSTSPDQQLDVSGVRLLSTLSLDRHEISLESLARGLSRWLLASRSAWLFYTSTVRIVYFMRAARLRRGRSGLLGVIYVLNDNSNYSKIKNLGSISIRVFVLVGISLVTEPVYYRQPQQP